MDNIFYQLSMVLIAASAIGIIAHRLKLPLVVAYLISGMIISFIRVFDINHSMVFEILPEIGIAFVLFLIGMELKLNELRVLGKPIIMSAVGQVFVTTLIGLLIGKAFGIPTTESLYLGLGLAFSSTVVVVKMLLESRDINSLYGKLSVGILLIEDLIAIIALIVISITSGGNISYGDISSIGLIVVKALILFIVTFFFSKHFLNKLFEYTAKSTELLFITSVAWCFVFTGFAVFFGFSVEIGAFLAGVALASSPYHLQIQAKIKPMRDFFLALFFIYLGSTANFTSIFNVIPIVVGFVIYAVIVKPFIYMYILSRYGFKKHTFFQTGLNLSQISEFSLIVLMIGVKEGIISQNATTIMSLVAVFSITISSILISVSRKVYNKTQHLTARMELIGTSHQFENRVKKSLADHVVVIGAHRVGSPIINYIHASDIPLIVMDFNPTIVSKLTASGIHTIYGDIGDPEVVESLELERAKLIICTASDYYDNQLLLFSAKEKNSKATVVLRANDTDHAKNLMAEGADYVIVPEKVSGDYIVNEIRHHWPNVTFKDKVSSLK